MNTCLHRPCFLSKMGKVMKAKAVGKKAIGHSIAKLEGQRRKGFVAQKAERGHGLKFKLETFAAVSKFTPGTRIKYGPNRKRPDSKSFTRYAGYCKAKTVGESLKFGAKIADFLWELERGDYQLLAQAPRTEAQEVAAIGRAAYDRAVKAFSSFIGPQGLAMSLTDPRAAEQLKAEEAWRSQKLKKMRKACKGDGFAT